MRFQVPQFIEVEDKLFGPLTIKQAIYLAGGAGIIVIAWSFLPKFFAFLITIPTIALAVSLAFWKNNNRPFIVLLESGFKYYFKEKLYVWKKEEKKVVSKEKENRPYSQVNLPHLSKSKLKDLMWSLEVNKDQQAQAPGGEGEKKEKETEINLSDQSAS